MGTASLFFAICAIVLAMFGTATCFLPLEFVALPLGLLAIGLALIQLSRSGWRSWKQADQTLACPYAVGYAWRALAIGGIAAIWAVVVIARDFGPLMREWGHHY